MALTLDQKVLLQAILLKKAGQAKEAGDPFFLVDAFILPDDRRRQLVQTWLDVERAALEAAIPAIDVNAQQRKEKFAADIEAMKTFPDFTVVTPLVTHA